MEQQSITRRIADWRLALSVLAILVAILAWLQYSWIGEVSQAQRKALEEQLAGSLNAIRRDLNREFSTAATQLVPGETELEQWGLSEAYARRHREWLQGAGFPGVFRGAGLALPAVSNPPLQRWNSETQRYESATWPESWAPLVEWVEGRTRGTGPGQAALRGTTLWDIPRFGPQRAPGPGASKGPRPMQGEIAWLFLDIDPEYVAREVFPELLGRHLGEDFAGSYQVDVVQRYSGEPIYRSDNAPTLLNEATAAQSVTLLDLQSGPGGPGPGRGPPGDRKGEPKGPPQGPPPVGRKEKNPPEPGPGGGRWLLLARPQAGSLDAVVERFRLRNFFISGLVLLMLMATAALVVRLSREMQRVAAMQMDFVAGISHELRTPLTVIRTAAFNLRGKLAQQPTQVEQYGILIQRESEKLGGIVEQVLRYSSASAGQVLQARIAVNLEDVVNASLGSVRLIAAEEGIEIEGYVEPGLPLIQADAAALRHALENLIENAMKYGDRKWVGVRALSGKRQGVSTVEVHVSDRGPGIPAEEQDLVFGAFFRGKRAQSDQVRGTGLGLNLAKKIVEAHGGEISVESSGQGTTFVVSLPV